MGHSIDDTSDDYLADLTPKQKCLVHAVEIYGAKEAEKEGFDGFANEMRNTGGVCNKIEEIVQDEMELCGYSRNCNTNSHEYSL